MRSRTNWIALILGTLFLMGLVLDAGMATSQVVEDLAESAEVVAKRQIRELEERLRLLYDQHNDREVIDQAEALMKLDPKNATAYVLKAAAESRIARGESGRAATGTGRLLPSAGMGPARVTPTPEPAQPVQPALVTPDPVSPATHSPAPAVARRDTSQIKLYIGLGIGLLLIIGALILLMIILRNRREVQEQAVARPANRPALDPLLASYANVTDYGTEVADMPTLSGDENDDYISDEVTNVGNVRTGVGTAVGTGFGDMVTNQPEPATNVGDPATLNEDNERSSIAFDIPPPPPAPEPDPDSNAGLKLDDLVMSTAPAPEPKAGLGIDYSDTDSPMARSQAHDIYQTSEKAFSSTPAEKLSAEAEATLAYPEADFSSLTAEPAPAEMEATLDISMPLPPASKPAPAPPLVDPDSTRPIQAKPAPAAPPPLDIAAGASSHAAGAAGADLSFNSLMFGGESAPATPAPAPAGNEADELTLGTFNRQFSDVMFGASMEETLAPAPAPKAEDPDKTAFLGALPSKPAPAPAAPTGDDPDKTANIARPAAPAPAAPAAGGQKLSMFERQKQAGEEAIAAGDFAKAVQCFSVAASLKPGDKEIRALLDDAREKRKV